MSRKKNFAAYMFRTPTVRNVRLTRKAKIFRLTWLRLLHYPKTYGMSCASSVEIVDVSHKHLAAYMFRTLTVRNVRVTRESKISRLTRLQVCALSEALPGTSCASSVEILDVSHKAPCHLHVPNPYGTECASYEKV